VTENGHKVTYAVGQPMGFKSSFNMMAFTHHFIVAYAAILAGLPTFTDYAILGDDLVLTNKDVVHHYREIMAKLGVEINKTKSLIPTDEPMSSAEFCKRIVTDGEEITGMPVVLLANSISESAYTISL